MHLIYVAGPFRGSTPWATERNVRIAEAMALEVWRLPAAALCPHANTRYFDGLETPELWINGTLEMLRRCDAMLVVGLYGVDGGESQGTKGEIEAAKRWRIPVFHNIAELKEWLRREA
jgi:hypothetical protein